MPDEKVSVVIFEGGPQASQVEEEMGRIRKALVLDLIDTVKSLDDVDEIVVRTTYDDLAREVRDLGALASHFDPSEPFHFGRALKDVLSRFNLQRVIYLGGAAMPLLRADEWASIARCLKTQDRVVVVNNVQSADLVAFNPASGLDEIELPEADNFLGWLLREIGYRRILLPNSARANFDLDTPVDIQILHLQSSISLGPNASRALDSLNWDTSRLENVWHRLSIPNTEVSLLGRVGPSVVNVLNASLRCRVRVFSEERGMKALGREEAGLVVSLIGGFVDDVGPERFFRHLADISDVALFDTRVLMAHWGEEMAARDRFLSDLGIVEGIQSSRLKEFTQAYLEAPLPVICGGHNLISGGLWLMVEEIVGTQPEDPETL